MGKKEMDNNKKKPTKSKIQSKKTVKIEKKQDNKKKSESKTKKKVSEKKNSDKMTAKQKTNQNKKENKKPMQKKDKNSSPKLKKSKTKHKHPQFYTKVKVTCSCGNTFFTASTQKEIHTEICSKCHPFYTGEQRIVDTENLVAKFKKRAKKAISKKKSFMAKRARLKKQRQKASQQKPTKALTLKDMLKNLDEKAKGK